MITINELRQGNWVSYDDANWQINMADYGSDEVDLFNDDHISGLDVNAITEIKLSEYVLKCCGFHKHNNAWVEKDFTENNSKFYFSIWNQIEDEYKYNSAEFDIELKSLHQLQNLYYALRGVELDVVW